MYYRLYVAEKWYNCIRLRSSYCLSDAAVSENIKSNDKVTDGRLTERDLEAAEFQFKVLYLPFPGVNE
jgi:hypothetical protein